MATKEEKIAKWLERELNIRGTLLIVEDGLGDISGYTYVPNGVVNGTHRILGLYRNFNFEKYLNHDFTDDPIEPTLSEDVGLLSTHDCSGRLYEVLKRIASEIEALKAKV